MSNEPNAPEEQGESTRTLEWRRAKVAAIAKSVEHRTLATPGMELRAADDGSLTLSGYATVYDAPYDMGWYTESIARGAGRRTLAERPDVTLLLNHEGLPLARTTATTLRLSEDDHGLKVDASLDPDDPDARMLARKMGRGDLDGQMSFAFRATQQTWNEDYTDRVITEYNLHRGDVSVVTQGANPLTTSSVRSLDAMSALAALGGPRVIAAFVEWRNFTLLDAEARAGKALSGATMEVLTQVLNLVATADDAVDEAQPLLADLMGVANPDADDERNAPPPVVPPEPRIWTPPDQTTERRRRLATLIGGA